MKYKWFSAAFLLLCLIPSVGMLFAPETQPAGNERLAPAPRLWTEDRALNPAVLDEATEYVADHFALRQQMVTLNAAIQTRLFASSPAQDVIWGSDGWLYYGKTLDDYQNRAALSAEEARQAAQLVADMQAYCEEKGAEFLFTIAPNKNSLYPEHMPGRYLQSGDAGNYERVEPYLRELSVNYADLFTFFGAQEEILYLKTDSHWSNRGAALVHDFIMQRLGRPHTGFAGMPYQTAETHRGDLYEMLYPAGTAREEQQQYAFSFEHVTPPRSPEDILIRTVSKKGTGRLLFCRDSFGNALYPFLAEDFAEATVTRAMPYPFEQVREGDVVIVEIVERNLGNLLKYPPELSGTN